MLVVFFKKISLYPCQSFLESAFFSHPSQGAEPTTSGAIYYPSSVVNTMDTKNGAHSLFWTYDSCSQCVLNVPVSAPRSL